MNMPGPLEVVVILTVVLLLFGAKRLPEIGRALGEGIREFKKSLKDGSSDQNQNPPKAS
ncbi:MAG: twin-arginine translocase TatA/TatE family subunit [Candidatus Omnitrophica bacterium]|nr:twin-arginine translocase TatA/TatE family subunit [Candidatus Omnitrophota bacterium]